MPNANIIRNNGPQSRGTLVTFIQQPPAKSSALRRQSFGETLANFPQFIFFPNIMQIPSSSPALGGGQIKCKISVFFSTAIHAISDDGRVKGVGGGG